MFNGKTLSEQEKEGSQKETTGSDSQEGATSEFKKVLDVEKTSEQDEAPQEEVKSLVFVEPELPPAIDTPLPPPLGDGCSLNFKARQLSNVKIFHNFLTSSDDIS